MSNPRKALGTALEKRVVEKAREAGLSSTKQPLSGVLKDFPSDVVVEDILVECKVRGVEIDARGQRYIRLDLDWLTKVEKEADRMGFEWAAVVVNPKYSKYPSVLISLEFFLELLVDSKPETIEETDPIAVEQLLERMAGKGEPNRLFPLQLQKQLEESLKQIALLNLSGAEGWVEKS